jgi:hypothetical protein
MKCHGFTLILRIEGKYTTLRRFGRPSDRDATRGDTTGRLLYRIAAQSEYNGRQLKFPAGVDWARLVK